MPLGSFMRAFALVAVASTLAACGPTASGDSSRAEQAAAEVIDRISALERRVGALSDQVDGVLGSDRRAERRLGRLNARLERLSERLGSARARLGAAIDEARGSALAALEEARGSGARLEELARGLSLLTERFNYHLRTDGSRR